MDDIIFVLVLRPMKKEYNYPLRLPIAVAKLLRKEAKVRKWSLNTYINHILEQEVQKG